MKIKKVAGEKIQQRSPEPRARYTGKVSMQIREMAVRFALESNKQLDYTTDNSKSKLPRKAAFGSDLVHGDGGKYDNLPMWVLKSKAGRHNAMVMW